jgi:hypothetical protein
LHPIAQGADDVGETRGKGVERDARSHVSITPHGVGGGKGESLGFLIVGRACVFMSGWIDGPWGGVRRPGYPLFCDCAKNSALVPTFDIQGQMLSCSQKAQPRCPVPDFRRCRVVRRPRERLPPSTGMI